MYDKNEIQKEKKEHQSRKKMRASQKFAVAQQRSDPVDYGADLLRKAQVEDITMKSVWERAQESDTIVYFTMLC